MGPSMNPTLRSGDRLDIITYNGEKIRRGDVVVFTPPGSDSNIVHRIVFISSQGIKTRGDNCSQKDEWLLSSDHIFGRVVRAERRNKLRRVAGGPTGFIWATVLKAIHSVDSRLSLLLRPAYDRLARTGTFRLWLPRSMEPKVLSFDRAAGTELQLLIGRRVIGRWPPGKSGWQIRRPYRLFVDEAALPENPAKQSVVRDQLSVADKDM